MTSKINGKSLHSSKNIALNIEMICRHSLSELAQYLLFEIIILYKTQNSSAKGVATDLCKRKGKGTKVIYRTPKI